MPKNLAKKPKNKYFIIEDDELFADCIKSSIKKADKTGEILYFKNCIDAINSLLPPLPNLIFLDVLLPGPDGFTFLNEISSYVDTSKIPVVLVTSLKLADFDLNLYEIKGILEKEEMEPKEIIDYVKRYSHPSNCS